MRAAFAASILLLCSVASADLSLRDAIVYVEADPVGGGRAYLSAVCVSEDGVYLTAGHGGFTKGRQYVANRGLDTEPLYTLECVSDRALRDDKGEGVVVLKDVGKHKHAFVPIGETPELASSVYGMGYAGGRFTYTEMMITGYQNGARFLVADARLLEGCSGGGLFCNDRLVGILSTRSQLPGEIRDGSSPQPPYTRWIGVDVFEPCVRPFLEPGE